jgi:hypothetical protein
MREQLRGLNAAIVAAVVCVLVGCSMPNDTRGSDGNGAPGAALDARAGDAGGAVGGAAGAARDVGAALRTAGVAAGVVSPPLGAVLAGVGILVGGLADYVIQRRRRRPWSDLEREQFRRTGAAPAGKPPRPSRTRSTAPVVKLRRAA